MVLDGHQTCLETDVWPFIAIAHAVTFVDADLHAQFERVATELDGQFVDARLDGKRGRWCTRGTIRTTLGFVGEHFAAEDAHVITFVIAA